jgi:hypothetical protein
MSNDDAFGVPVPRPDYTAQEDSWLSGGRLPPPVRAEQPPPADMPPLPLMILDALADGPENIYAMRNCGEMTAHGVALVGEAHLLDALRSLLSDGLITVEHEHAVVADRVGVRALAGKPGTSDHDLRRYWFSMTPTGREAWEAAADVLDAYWDAHPLEPRTDIDDTAPTT